MLAALKDRVVLHLSVARNLSRNPKFWLVWAVDICLLLLALYFSFLLRFEGGLTTSANPEDYISLLPLIIIIKIPVFYFFGLYRGMWRYTSTDDLRNIVKATLLGAILVLVTLLYVNRLQGLSRSVFILDALLTFLFISGHRVVIRYLYTKMQGSRRYFSLPVKPQKKRLLLIGAGDAADIILRELKSNPKLPYRPVGLVDDDIKKTGLKIHGVPVVGLVEDITDHITRTRAQELLITVASATGPQMKRLAELCQTTNIPFKVVPGFGELVGGRISVKAIRDISYKDLLGRAEVELEQDKIGRYLTGKTVLVTGAGGTIGSELCRQILRFAPGRLILFDASEENLYAIQMELIHELDTNNAVAVLGRVQDVRLLDFIFRTHRPAVVFHAAAYKHVPLVERNPWQAVHNNIFAAQLLIEAAIIHQVERFVLVSTDKAVRPTNVMGASKRMTELLLHAYDRNSWDKTFTKAWKRILPEIEESPKFESRFPIHETRFMSVRFGNVIGSSGSVIPLFTKQIERGGPLTVTHPEITRYFMSIDEAAQLILQAGSMAGEETECFILKMGEPIKIDHMARELIRLAGKEPDTEIEITYTGLREGEKLYEELITEGEGIVDTHHKKIMVLRGDGFIPCSLFHGFLEQLAEAARTHDDQAIKKTLKEMIPEYKPDNSCGSIGEFGVAPS